MIRITTLASMAMFLLCATASHATVTISVSSQPTPGLPDYLTYTYTAVSTEPLLVFDFAGNGNSDPPTGKGFFSPMNQVNPLGQTTVFADSNAFFAAVGADVLQDSQFLLKTKDATTTLNTRSFESANLLQGVWAWKTSSSPGNTFPFAQIVAPASSPSPLYHGEIVTGTNGVNTLFRVGNFPFSNNLPPVVTDSTISAVANDLINYRFQATDPDDPVDSLTWSNFSFTGPGINLQPTFDPISRDFNWNTSGSQAGTYLATVRATDPHGKFDEGTLRINLTSPLPPPPPPPPDMGSGVIYATAVPTPGLPGYETWTLTARAGAGEKIVGFDFAGGGGTYGIFGPMNQINPVGLPTVFNDNNALFGLVGADASQDSQFKVKSTDGITIGAVESPGRLQAAFNYLPAYVPTGESWPFAQLVIPIAGDLIYYIGTLTVVDSSGTARLVQVAGIPNFIPEPATLALLGIAGLYTIGFTRRRHSV